MSSNTRVLYFSLKRISTLNLFLPVFVVICAGLAPQDAVADASGDDSVISDEIKGSYRGIIDGLLGKLDIIDLFCDEVPGSEEEEVARDDCKKLYAYSIAWAKASCYAVSYAWKRCKDGSIEWDVATDTDTDFDVDFACNYIKVCTDKKIDDLSCTVSDKKPIDRDIDKDPIDKGGEEDPIDEDPDKVEDDTKPLVTRTLRRASAEEELAEKWERSFAEAKSYARYAPINTFYAANILELENHAPHDSLMEFAIAGQEDRFPPVKLSIAAGQKLDVIAEDLFDLPSKDVSVLSIRSSHRVNGRAVTYETRDAAFSDIVSASAVELVPSQSGRTVLTANSFYPGNASGKRVAKWLGLINLDTTKTQEFVVTFFDYFGKLVGTKKVLVEAMSRLDISGGHDIFPQDSLWAIEIKADGPYLAQGARVGIDLATGVFDFTNTVLARKPLTKMAYSLIERVADEHIWYELTNPNESARSKLSFKLFSGGELRADLKVTLGEIMQQHIPIHELIDSGEQALIVTEPLDERSGFLANTMVYEVGLNSVGRTYIVPARTSVGERAEGSANFFLGHQNQILLANVTGEANQVTIRLGDYYSETFSLTAYQVLTLDLPAIPDTYASVAVEATKPFVGQVLRKAARYVVPLALLPMGANAADTVESLTEGLDFDKVFGIVKGSGLVEFLHDYLEDVFEGSEEGETKPECYQVCATATATAEAVCKATACAKCPDEKPLCHTQNFTERVKSRVKTCAELCIEDGTSTLTCRLRTRASL